MKTLKAVLQAVILHLGLVTAVMAEPVELEHLAQSERWQALLHINQDTTWRNRGRSYVPDSSFFLADKGRDNPLAELEATYAALLPVAASERCRFPARYRFLAENLGWEEKEPFVHCEKYRQWRDQVPTGFVDLVFPAAYLNSPSSMFGHTLLRIDSGRDEGAWLSQAVSFGAMVDESDNSIRYIYRGLAGGYPGHFTMAPYVRKIQDYAHLENRDMWEYRLNLDENEITWLVAHLWELRDIRFDYYFFDENCSFRLLELLAVARPGSGLLDEFRFTEIPVDTVRALYRAGMVSKRDFRPSKQRELEQLRSLLSYAEQKMARELAFNPALSDSQRFQRLQESRLHLMARLAYEYLRFEHRKGERDAEVAKSSLALLRIVNSTASPELPVLKQPASPEKGHDTRMLSLKAGYFMEQEYLGIGYRFTYHDWLDNTAGFLQGAQIEGLNLDIRYYRHDKLEVERLDVVNIRSLAPRNPFVRSLSWFVHGGFERAFIKDERPLSAFVQGGPGLAWQWGSLIPYGYLSARLEHHGRYAPFIESGLGASIGMLWYGRQVNLGIESEGYHFAERYQLKTAMKAQFPLARNQGLRIQLHHEYRDEVDELGAELGWRYYF